MSGEATLRPKAQAGQLRLYTPGLGRARMARRATCVVPRSALDWPDKEDDE